VFAPQADTRGGITSSWGGRIGGDELPRASDVTIAEFLKTQNYDTAAMGKWHLGGAFYRTNGDRIPGGDNASFNNPRSGRLGTPGRSSRG